jgi:hypothetical protein
VSDAESAITRIREALDSGRLTVNALDDGSGVLLDIDGEQLLTLNASGMHLVQSIENDQLDVAGLRDRLCDRFEVEADRAESDARAFVIEVAGAL